MLNIIDPEFISMVIAGYLGYITVVVFHDNLFPFKNKYVRVLAKISVFIFIVAICTAIYLLLSNIK